jgi:hypothetical protein
MSQDAKIRTIGAKKAPEILTVAKLITFAEQVIRTDKLAALRAQQGVSDLTAKTNDRSESQARISALNELCGKSGFVKVKTDDAPDEDAKLIQFCKPRVGS